MNVLLLVLASAVAVLGGESSGGSVRLHVVQLEDETPQTIESKMYPERVAPWTFETHIIKSKPGTLVSLNCQEVTFVSELMPQETFCGDFMLYVKDGEKRQEICGEKRDVRITSSTNEITLEMRTGLRGKGAFSCQAQAIRE